MASCRAAQRGFVRGERFLKLGHSPRLQHYTVKEGVLVTVSPVLAQ